MRTILTSIMKHHGPPTSFLVMSRRPSDHSRVTLHAVATRAGVSAMTVSNVINGTGRVSADTRERVLSAIGELGYVPNQSARRLTGAGVTCVGLICADVDSVFVEMTLAAVAVVAAECGVQLQIRSAADPSLEATIDVARDLVGKGAQALMLLPPYAEALGQDPRVAALDVPIAAIATGHALPYIATIRIDNRSAAKSMTELVIAHGRRRIAVLSGPLHHSDSVARVEGYRDALREHALPIDPALCIECDFTFQSGLVAAQQLLSLENRPDAIIAGNDDMAAAVLWIAHHSGLSIPGDLSVTGFDDTVLATRVWPPLTTVRQPVRVMAAAAMEYLSGSVRHPQSGPVPLDTVIPFEMIERGSV
ncbi:LacI family DNA-binding transcriptional regulator [Novosphingobium sp. PhB55]|uniref:LacI family DNA-binding transcriptional regulator n=1 Tax=Novosphingobium sp. PhB55 TaxID=2485106 RepID=UPI001FBAE05F|nr:LacI family DNA-binding transcriptional regulator [Novosphingobium sp. PhB55]